MNKTHTHRYSVCVYVCVSAWNVNDDYNDKNKRAEWMNLELSACGGGGGGERGKKQTKLKQKKLKRKNFMFQKTI